MSVLLELRQLAVSFATDDGTVRAVDGIDLSLERGRTLGLVGESGCGKSVTSLAVMGLLPPENSMVKGEVRFEGRDLLTLDASTIRDMRGARLARLELQIQQLQQQSGKFEDQSRKALAAGREDLAREALTRRSGVQQQQADLATQHAALQAEEEKLTLASQRLQAKVDAFRTRKETIKATYSAAEAQTKIGEAFSGISEEMGDVGLAVQRAEDKTQALQARAGAIDELLASGALDDVSGTAKDDLTVELERLSSEGDVELELARLKGEIGAGSAPEAIEGATPPAAQPAAAPQAEEDRS
jgi:phage shock protein A